MEKGKVALGNTTVHLKLKRKSDEAFPVSGASQSEAQHKYDVFINHRGPDVKLTFVAHLNDALKRAGFRPFMDAKCIMQGRHVFNSINAALSGACVHVAVFSKRYAESKYCLEELCDMLQSGKVILPVFYDVAPQDLRWIENGPFDEGFRKHQKCRSEKIPQWKKALEDISSYRGFRMDEVNGDENQLVRNVVLAVSKAVPVDLVAKKLRFGLKESLKDVLKRLDAMKDNVGILGIVGMGGIGKTTLASEVYNHFVSHQQFQSHNFLKDVRSNAPFDVRQQLLRDLIQGDLQSTSSQDYLRGFNAFSRQKVLTIVDDIDNAQQFENLIPDIRQLTSGSRIVITSRHQDVLIYAMRLASCKDLYEVQVLDCVGSRQLFNWHAFLGERPNDGFQDLAEKVADACGGYPLALEVIGASLYGKKNFDEREIWMETIATLKENKDILDKLRISYDSLPTEGDKAIFRDIACMFIGMREDVAMAIWRSCNSCSDYCSTSKVPHLVLRSLMDKSLVKVEHGRLRMHDMLRDLGRNIAKNESLRKPEKRTFLWEPITAAKVLNKNKGTDRVRGINLSLKKKNDTLTCLASKFASMGEQHLLVLDGRLLVLDDLSNWSQELRWLQWRALPYTELPKQLNLPKLVVLNLTESRLLTRLWANDAHIQFPSLQILILRFCSKLEELPPNIGESLPRLKTLDMKWCCNIEVLPDSIGQMKQLEHLILSYCFKLAILPDELGKLHHLEELDLSGCSSLRRLPTSMGGLQRLKKLDLDLVPRMELPSDLEKLTCLTSLSISDNWKIGHFERLTSSFEAFTALKTLKLWMITTLKVLPVSLGNLKSLVHLKICLCPALLRVERLPHGLHHLDFLGCSELTQVPSLAGMSFLMSLSFHNCQNLTHIQGLECLTALEEIDLSGCTLLVECGLLGMHNRALRKCRLSGSNVAVAYDNRWLEREPASQILSYDNDAIEFLPNGMAEKVVTNARTLEKVIMEVTISSEAECVALILCFLAHTCDQNSCIDEKFDMVVQITRDGMLVSQTSDLFFMSGVNCGQVILWSLRRGHLIVQSLQLGDHICVYITPRVHEVPISVLEGAICVVHAEDEGAEDEHLILEVNSELLSQGQSKDLATKFEQLVLGDHCSHISKPELRSNETESQWWDSELMELNRSLEEPYHFTNPSR